MVGGGSFEVCKSGLLKQVASNNNKTKMRPKTIISIGPLQALYKTKNAKVVQYIFKVLPSISYIFLHSEAHAIWKLF